MKSSQIRYGTRLCGCRFGQAHDFVRLGETPQQTWEQCKICGIKKKWNKGYRGRIANTEYLKAHVRQFAQDFGSTKRVYMKIYKPEQTIIKL